MSEIINETSNKKKALGRGLGSLLGGASTSESNTSKPTSSQSTSGPQQSPSLAAATLNSAKSAVQSPTNVSQQATITPPVDPESKIWKVAIDKLSSGEFQPRRHFEKEALQELAQSIRENGILQPIVARRTTSGKLEIVAGERRWRAAQLAGLHEVPVILRNFADKEALELAIVENIQREDLNPIEEAEGYFRLINEFKLSQQQVAEKVGKDRATVANAVRILMLPQEVKEFIASNELSVGHAKVLLTLQDGKQQVSLAKRVVSDKIAVRKLEKMVQAAIKGEAIEIEPSAKERATLRALDGVVEDLQKALGTKVNIDYNNSKGKVSIHFYSDDELNNLVDKLKEGCQ